jgi:hypothetical protein
MAYASKKGRRPLEYASKASHREIISDPLVSEFLDKCIYPKGEHEITLPKKNIVELQDLKNNPIRNVVVIDSGVQIVQVKNNFPSSTVTFFQIGALMFEIEDLTSLSCKPFIDPEDISRLKEIQRFKLVVPTKNVSVDEKMTFTDSVRSAIYDFFSKEEEGVKLIEGLKWLIFEEYKEAPAHEWNLASCPNCQNSNIPLIRSDMASDFTFACKLCSKRIFLTDVFRLHEVIDDELGAGGIIGYLTTSLEQIILAYILRVILKIKPKLLYETLFLVDGPLAFFGQTALLHKTMRKLVNYLSDNYDIFLAGVEKSGAFVDHAAEISHLLDTNQMLLLDNEHIYKYIIPGRDRTKPYGNTSYYGHKTIFKSIHDNIYVVTLPTREPLLTPQENDFKNLNTVLKNIEHLKCDMYDDAIIPVTLVNKLVSLSAHPSAVILEKFAKSKVNH